MANLVSRRTASRFAAALAIGCMLAASVLAAEYKSDSDADRAAIRAAIESYVTAFNRGDAKAVAAHWSEAGQWISPRGERFEGRAAIEKEMQAVFSQSKGAKLEVLQPTVRLVSADVAVEEGTVRVTQRDQSFSESTYVAIHVKQKGQWKLDSVRETDLPESAPPNSPLAELAWLVGQWRDASAEAAGETTITWTKNKAFLTYGFKVSTPGMDDLEGTQVIGWDPAAGTIRSWMFDSDGGFGEGTWSKKGDDWVVKFEQVMPDGRIASATNIYTLFDANTFTWKSIGRKVGDEFLPNVEPIKMVRKGIDETVKAEAKPAKKPR